jgi:ribosome-associated toxin RatA of RatAB toxin-antitoxin module
VRPRLRKDEQFFVVKKILLGLLVVLGLGAVVLGWRYYRVVSSWEGPVPEILSETLEKNTDTMSVMFTSRVDAPIDAVFRAFSEPERGMEFSNIIRYSKLVQNEGNRKIVEFEMVILGQPQHFTLAFAFFPNERRVTIQTVENPLTELNGEYKFTASPDGAKTMIAYTGTAKDKVKIPIPLALQKSALRETFVADSSFKERPCSAAPKDSDNRDIVKIPL